MPLAESRGGASGGVWGNAPTVFRALNSKEATNQGAGSEASLPLTLRSRRSAPKPLYLLLAYCRAKWARPDSRKGAILLMRQTRTVSLDTLEYLYVPDVAYATYGETQR